MQVAMGGENNQGGGVKFGADAGSLSLRQRAIRLLAGREQSRAELTKKLAAHGTAEEVAAVLDELQELQLLSDERVAASYVRSHAARLGRSRLAQTLRSKGISGELATEQLDAQLDTDSDNDEFQRATVLWTRKFGSVPVDAKAWAKQARFLQYRGFSGEVIRKILRDAKEAESELKDVDA